MPNQDSQLKLNHFKIPHLPMIVREAFAVYSSSHEEVGHMTVSHLADCAHLPIKGVLERLQAIETMAETSEISVHELKALLDSGKKNVFLLDVRERWEFDICRIEGSMLMAKLDLAQIFPGLKEFEVITICHHGVRSLSTAFYLKEAGLPRVRSLTGGTDAWSQLIDTSMPRY
ncbi:MAG: hypothetical protein EOP10_19895 [Proteobacteria bacterium]|nr:MAG: hypothetical protein EOP10_19895 [Pseudomonadota bacterium]